MIAFIVGCYVTGAAFVGSRIWCERCSKARARFDRLQVRLGVACFAGAIWPLVVALQVWAWSES